MTPSVVRSGAAFHEALREARQRAGLTQSQLSERARVSRRTLIRWEAGDASPWIPELRSVLDALSLSEADRTALMARLTTSRGRIAWDMCSVAHQAAVLKMARLRANLLGSELAEAMGCHPSQVARWEAANLCPRDLDRLFEALNVTPREREELSAEGFDVPLTDTDLDDRILGITWPWDPEGYLLFDVRFLRLFAVLGSEPKSAGNAMWLPAARAAYAWMLATCGRNAEAREYAESVLETFPGGELAFGPAVITATMVAARCGFRSGARRNVRGAFRLLDGLDMRPLAWDSLASRYDAYSEGYARIGAWALAYQYSDRAIEAAAHAGQPHERLMRTNRIRLMLMHGEPERALEYVGGLSGLSPLNDAGEAMTLAAILSSLGHETQAVRWREVAQDLIDRFQLHCAFARGSDGIWGVPPLTAAV